MPALGLGEISLHSALNQPLDAQIELLEVGDLDNSEVKVSLASADAFERADVDRFIFLNDLRFSPVIRGSSSHIRVVSNKPVLEPYLNFIVEVARPNGKLLREYTLLLDPPGSAAYTASAAPVSPARAVPVATRSQAPVQPKPAPAATQGKHYQVARGDSLWLIAKRLSAGSGMTQQQVLDGIQALNAQAFPGGDINRLHVGQSLLLPDEIAVAEVPAAPVAPAAAPIEAPAPVAAGPSLTELTQAQQRVDSSLEQGEAERAQLRQDIAELQARLESMQQQLSGSDREMTELQAQVQNITAEPVAAPISEAPQAKPEPVLALIPAAQATEQLAPAQAGQSGISPFWWVIMSTGLVLLFILDWVLLRRSRQENQQQELEEAQTTGKAKVAFQHRQAHLQPVTPAKPELVPATVRPAVALQLVPAPAVKASHDALEGANIYIAYGRWREALGVLRPAIDQEPKRLELRYRLLEVLGELRDSAAFAHEEAALRDLQADEECIAAIRARYAEVGPASTPAEPVFVLDELSPIEVSNEPIDSRQSDFDGYPMDADWEQVSPFKTAEPKRKAAVVQAFPTVEEDIGFPANLQELPEVFELTLDADTLTPFGELPELSQAETLDEFTAEFVDPLVSLEELDKLDARKENLIKLNLALAYIEQGNIEAACSILNEVISEGDDQQKQEARDLLAKIA
ncbi:FimV/HubP family polar landmark protein [Pseudomonas sp. BN417]|uniref:FimV/HubP family polar landmark protein n=1 Tax=Pseudomonas sp. BN417 TaxID=2567890 RepID=UPI0032AF635A